MQYSAQYIASIISNNSELINLNAVVEFLCIDSRKISFPEKSLFFAIKATHKNGHEFIKDVYEMGCRNFVVEKTFSCNEYSNANFFKVDNVIYALQKIAKHHRQKFNIPIIGITGSNGKTIIKEWLNQMLCNDFDIARSPASYNSQIGVPLSVWQINEANNLGIFEAGISTIDEMGNLEEIIKPSIGVFTNLGMAHKEGFKDDLEKVREKSKLFVNANSIVYHGDDEVVKTEFLNLKKKKKISWGFKAGNEFKILGIIKETSSSKIYFEFENNKSEISIPFIDDASIENIISCCCVVLILNYTVKDLQVLISKIHPVAMRMQYYQAIQQCTVINDSYSFDLNSFLIALNFLDKQLQKNKTVIISDLPNAFYHQQEYKTVIEYLNSHNISKCVFIGNEWSLFFNKTELKFNFKFSHYSATNDFLRNVKLSDFSNEAILLKAARNFQFEKINQLFEIKVHQTILEINLSALTYNLKTIQSKLKPGVKLMAMVKAFGYGSGSVDVAQLLQFNKVNYLGVAYTDEAIELRKAGIHLPIMVMNVDEQSYKSIVQYNLEPEIFSFEILQEFTKYLNDEGIKQYPVHLKIDTGMHRLGFLKSEINNLVEVLLSNQAIQIKSVFSHLVASEDEQFDDFTLKQKNEFAEICKYLEEKLQYNFIKHISNSAAIHRHSDLQFDMVRLGIGLYGINTEGDFKKVLKLKTTIAQIKKVGKGETIGYGRSGVLKKDSVIATIRIGYADGFSRLLGNAVGHVFVKNQLASVIGNVSMDMCMVDVTHIENIGLNDEVEIFGDHISVQQLAEWQKTIPYEALTSIGQRVKRIYYEE